MSESTVVATTRSDTPASDAYAQVAQSRRNTPASAFARAAQVPAGARPKGPHQAGCRAFRHACPSLRSPASGGRSPGEDDCGASPASTSLPAASEGSPGRSAGVQQLLVPSAATFLSRIRIRSARKTALALCAHQAGAAMVPGLKAWDLRLRRCITALVQSSRSEDGRHARARAMARRCFCPPGDWWPAARAPRHIPGSASTKACACARRASTSASVTSGRAKRMLSRTLPEKSTVSWGTTPIPARSSSWRSHARPRYPPDPPGGYVIQPGDGLTRVDLPDPACAQNDHALAA